MFARALVSIGFWVTLISAFSWCALESAAAIGGRPIFTSYPYFLLACDTNPSGVLFVVLWAALVVAGIGALIRRSVGIRGEWGASLAIAAASVVALAERFHSGEIGVLDADRGAILIVVAALAFAGSSRLWWMVLAPVIAATAIAPLAWLEYWRAMGLDVLVRAAGPVVIGAILASIVVVVRETRARLSETRGEINSVTSREELVTQALSNFASVMAAQKRGDPVVVQPTPLMSLAEEIETPLVTVEIENVGVPMASASVTYQDLQALANEALEAVRMKWASRPGIRLLLTAPADLSLPIAVRGSNDEVRVWLRSLVENGVDALGGRGVVRLTLKPTLTHVAMSVEDNGRGLGEDLHKKLGIKDPNRLGLDDVKAQAELRGARFDIHARLGVGTRVTLELSRIDALSALNRASRPSARRTSPGSNSLHA